MKLWVGRVAIPHHCSLTPSEGKRACCNLLRQCLFQIPAGTFLGSVPFPKDIKMQGEGNWADIRGY